MTKIKKILFLLLITLILVSCQDKNVSKDNNSTDALDQLDKYENMKITQGSKYAHEKTILRDLIITFSRLNNAVEKAQSAEDVTSALKSLYDSLQKLNPAIAQITQSNPDWGTSPPRELKDIINDYLTANQNFTEHTMNRVGQYLVDNPDNKELHQIYNKLKEL
ncbi:MAG: hypothetical protein JXR70_02105 [Spirochaetales bacterium]|nr:hypothetical protein [Spirochaetales bacterium]